MPVEVSDLGWSSLRRAAFQCSLEGELDFSRGWRGESSEREGHVSRPGGTKGGLVCVGVTGGRLMHLEEGRPGKGQRGTGGWVGPAYQAKKMVLCPHGGTLVSFSSITQDHRRGTLNNRNVVPYGPGSRDSPIKVWAGWLLLRPLFLA